MLILSRVCAEFRDEAGVRLFVVTPRNRLTFVEAPETIRRDPLYRMLLAEGSLEVAVTEDRVKELAISPGAEDFAYYERERPGLLFGLGMRNEALGACHPAHTKDWDIDEAGLSTGVRAFVQFVWDAMDGIPGIPRRNPA